MKAHGNRVRLGGMLFAAALAAVAILALPAIGLGEPGSDNGNGPRPAGTVASFDDESGELIVDLGDGGSISALVVRRTQIRCGEGTHHLRGHSHHRATVSHRGEDEPGDDRGGHSEEESGDDQGENGDGQSRHGDDQGENDDGQNTHGDDQGEDGNGHHGERCNVGDLVEGAVVMRAEIVLTHGKALYKKIVLLPPQFSAAT
jgi:hypothetical protein